MEELTARQKEVLEIVSRHIEEYGYPPTLREIGAKLGVSGTLGVLKHLDALERKGYLRRQEGSTRGITLSQQGQGVPLPIVGQVRAGTLHPAIEDIEGHFTIDRSQMDKGGTFFLRVKGDSMIHAHIVEGDLALVRPQPDAHNKDIVVAMVGGEATLKRFYREADRIRLQPENPNYDPIIVHEGDGEVSIVGKVVGIYRQME
ncbi:repressor LexA [Geomonas terrae]|uniref:LexA repressor n=1 Tax=Geomonas terrae TaxID=2562681 RepID=A0A4S1CIB2_9BACT|nr:MULTISPECIES: transcriptional repressor LexA [Geomonas]TGU70480.1 repressor LexA [Geomonas terrae]TGU72900.1 repressor LexA [Geomonas terrae]TSK05942.1 MAG: repressor LexA [Geobacter sp.]